VHPGQTKVFRFAQQEMNVAQVCGLHNVIKLENLMPHTSGITPTLRN